MTRSRRAFIAASALIPLIGCFEPIDGPDRPMAASDLEAARSMNAFGLALFQRAASNASATNIVVSPLSTALALALTANGAAGETRDEMVRMLALGDRDLEAASEALAAVCRHLRKADEKITLSIANSNWHHRDLEVASDFLDLAKRCFAADVEGLDFRSSAASGRINSWVDRQTKGKIPKIVPDAIPSDAVLYVINAIYFHGTWTKPFRESATAEAPFTRSDGSTVPCKLMHRSDELSYFETDALQAVDLPYGGGAFRMAVLLPKRLDGTDTVRASLDDSSWSEWKARFHERRGELFLPRFKVEFEAVLNDTLRAMGMRAAFDPRAADFSRMATPGHGQKLVVTEVKHKTFVEVNEKGTEAAAATSVEIGLVSARLPSDPFTMRVDHPFLFVIHETRTGAILFVGKVGDVRH